MRNNSETDRTGHKGEYMTALLLNEVASVNPYTDDHGLDFFCELRDCMGVLFFIQAKGSANPTYAETTQTISSLPINCRTIENYWLKLDGPVFVFMSDTAVNKTYYTLVDESTYKPTPGQLTHTFSIPLSNEIAHDNIGRFAKVVIEKQRKRSLGEIEHYLQEHYQKNPELYHDLDEIERFLEVMRGSDQTAQIEVKSLLRQRCAAGIPIAPRLAEELKSIFINCKDSVTQYHVLDILLLLNDKRLVSQILKQIERNMRFYEFKPYGPEAGLYTYTDFLFAALVKLNAADKAKEIKRFLHVKDATINRGAIRTCGDLQINSSIPDIMRLIGHPDNGIRHDVAQALSKLDSNKVVPKLEKILQTSKSKTKIANAIQALAVSENRQVIKAILPLANDPNRDIRKAVALYLGVIDPVKHIDLLLKLMTDEDLEVQSEAKRSVYKILATYSIEFKTSALPQSLTLSAEKLEQLALPLLKTVYAHGQLPQTVSLLSICKGPTSLATLVDIYFKEEGTTRKVEITGPSGNVEGIQFINLKTRILDILKQYDLPEVRDDIVKQIVAKTTNPKYIIIAGELKLKEAFMPLINLLNQGTLDDTSSIASALVSIDSVKAQDWAINTLRNNSPLGISLACIKILSQTGAEQEERDLIKAQIHRLIKDVKVRLNPCIYFYVSHYEVTEAIPIIVNDLETNFDILAEPTKYRMLETAIGLDTHKSRGMMIKILPVVSDEWKHIIISCLGEIGDSRSIAAIKEYRDYPNLRISKLVERILSKTSNV